MTANDCSLCGIVHDHVRDVVRVQSKRGSNQPATCCDDFMEPFSTHPCAKYLYQRNPSASAIGSLISRAVNYRQSIWVRRAVIYNRTGTKYQQPYTGYDTTKTAEECQVIMSDAELTAACNDFENSYENATKCCAMVYDASKQMCHCRYLDTTWSRPISLRLEKTLRRTRENVSRTTNRTRRVRTCHRRHRRLHQARGTVVSEV